MSVDAVIAAYRRPCLSQHGSHHQLMPMAGLTNNIYCESVSCQGAVFALNNDSFCISRGVVDIDGDIITQVDIARRVSCCRSFHTIEFPDGIGGISCNSVTITNSNIVPFLTSLNPAAISRGKEWCIKPIAPYFIS